MTFMMSKPVRAMGLVDWTRRYPMCQTKPTLVVTKYRILVPYRRHGRRNVTCYEH